MKQKNLLLSLMVLIILVFVSLFPTVVNADQDGRVLYLGISEIRTNDTPNMGYAIGDPNTNGAEGYGAKLWNIQEHTGPNESDPVKADGNKNIYCVKAGVGFSNTHRTATYNIFYDMKSQRGEIASNVPPMEEVVNGTIETDSGTINKYDALLALADMLYLIDDENDEEVKAAYLDAAGINSDEWDMPLTRDDIAAVQQAAIWYFTNYDDKPEGKYDKTDDSGWLNYTLVGSSYTSLSDYKRHETDEGYQRQMQAEQLYKYLIKTAIANANNYSNSGETTKKDAPAKVNTTQLNYELQDGNYILGPINITENSEIPYTIDFIVKNNGTEINDYQLLDSNKM